MNVDAGAIGAADIERADPQVRGVLGRYSGKPRRKADLRSPSCPNGATHAVSSPGSASSAFDRAADPAQRAILISDVRELAEEYGFGWCHYEARGGFGLCAPGDERPLKVRTPIPAALGMTARERAER